MTVNNDMPILSRPAFFSGQQLRAGDLDAVTSYHRELSWLHNRSLHNWGIANGYGVTGGTGASQVRVGAGFALDCQGHELILTEDQVFPIPAVVSDPSGNPALYFLTVSWLDDDQIDPELRAGLCQTTGAVRRPEQVNLRWQDPNDRFSAAAFRPGLDVVLATAEVQRCRLASDVSGAERRNAMPDEIPYVFSGETPRASARTPAGGTKWEFWPPDDESEGTPSPLGVSTRVNTAEAGFGSTPLYLAHVVGSREYDIVEDGPGETVIVDGYADVLEPGATGFTLRVIFPVDSFTGGPDGNFTRINPSEIVFDPSFLFSLTEVLEWSVVWVGVEG
jgi:hypothetical protein